MKYFTLCVFLISLTATPAIAITINANTPYEAKISKENNQIFLYHKDKKQTLSKDDDLYLDANGQRYKIDDFNFDGIDDIAIISGVGYGGVNIFYRLYLAKDNQYKTTNIEISNYKLYPQFQTVLSNYRSGPRTFNDLYKITQTKELSYFVQYVYGSVINTCSIKDWKSSTKTAIPTPKIASCKDLIEKHEANPAYAKVIPQKALLYNNNANKPNGMYLIKGDIVQILGKDETSRILIEFKGKKTTRKYINPQELQIIENPPTAIPIK